MKEGTCMSIENKISVVVPAYNAENTIGRCIESILNQRYGNLELLIVNDGSSDSTHKIISSYLKDKRIIYLKQNNKGVSSARNAALSHASGEYIIFVDADDCLSENSIENRIKYACNYDLVISNYYTMHNGKKNREKSIIEKKIIYKKDAFWSLSPKSSIGYQGYLWNKVFRRKIIEDFNIRFDESIYYGEDRLFIAEYIDKCGKFFLDEEYVYCYEMNGKSAMSAFNKVTENNYKKVMTEFIGLEKLQAIVGKYDAILFSVFEYYDFVTCMNFINNSDKNMAEFRTACENRAKLKLKNILFEKKEFYSIISKVKAVGHYILKR